MRLQSNHGDAVHQGGLSFVLVVGGHARSRSSELDAWLFHDYADNSVKLASSGIEVIS
jgi:hypothetical protein